MSNKTKPIFVVRYPESEETEPLVTYINNIKDLIGNDYYVFGAPNENNIYEFELFNGDNQNNILDVPKKEIPLQKEYRHNITQNKNCYGGTVNLADTKYNDIPF